jgi:phage terminase Nu1 subunit (DNA packaging protein)
MKPLTAVKSIDFTSVSASDVAVIFGVANGTVRTWKIEGCPCQADPEGKKSPMFSVPEVFQWKIEQEKTNVRKKLKAFKSAQADDDGGTSDESERCRRLRGDLYELDLANKRGLLVEVAVVRQMMGSAADTIRQQLQSMGRRICVKVAKLSEPDAVDEVLTEAYNGVLRRLSEKVEEVL